MLDFVLIAQGIGHFHVPGRWLFRGLSLTLRPKRALAILGPNGRGKTTLLRALAGLIAPREGSVDRDGRVAYVPAALTTAFDYTVLDIVLMGRAPLIGFFAQPTASDEHAAREALDRLDLSALARRAFGSLSSGERQMVLLARSLACGAAILAMDEPTAALDLAHKEQIAMRLKNMVDEGIALLFTTHDPDIALRLATDVLLMHEAGCTICGDAEAMLTSAHLSELFACDVMRVDFQNQGLMRTTFASAPAAESADDATS